MKKFLLVTILLFFSFLMYAQIGSTDYLNEKRGFKVFKLNTNISEYLRHIKLSRAVDNDTKEYSVVDTTLFFIGDNIRIKTIQIATYKDTISSIGVMVEPRYNYEFLRSLRAAYGMGTKPNKYIEKYRWISGGAVILLNYNAEYNGKFGFAHFMDMEVNNRKERAKNNDARNNINEM